MIHNLWQITEPPIKSNKRTQKQLLLFLRPKRNLANVRKLCVLNS